MSGAAEALERHLGAFAQGVDAILADYAADAVLITPERTFRGEKEIRGFFQGFLDQATPEFWDAFQLGAKTVEGDVAYVTWSSKPAVAMATDTLLVRDGKIAVQTFTALAG